MAKRKPHHRPGRKGPNRKPGGDRLALRQVRTGEFAFVPPRCARERSLDLEDVHEMIAAEEPEMARDELLYLVEGCPGFLEAHNLLAELALESGDIAVARGHFGFAYETGLEALPKGFSGRLPSAEGGNAAFFAAGCGLGRCLASQGMTAEAREVLTALTRFDPAQTDARSLLDQLDDHERTSSPFLPIL